MMKSPTRGPWKNEVYFIGYRPARALKFAVSYPAQYPDLRFKMDQTIRWLKVTPWETVETKDGPISQAALQREYGAVHAAVAYDVQNKPEFRLQIRGEGRRKHFFAEVGAPNLVELEKAALEGKKTKPEPPKTLESLVKYLTLIGGARDGHVFLRGAAVHSPEEVILFPGEGARRVGKTLAVLQALSQYYSPLSNSHIWLKFSGSHLYAYPQRLGEKLPVRVDREWYNTELRSHNLDVQAIDDNRKHIAADSLDARISESVNPKDMLIYFDAPTERIPIRKYTSEAQNGGKNLLVAWPDLLSLSATGQVVLNPRDGRYILNQLRKSWAWNAEQVTHFVNQFTSPKDKNAMPMMRQFRQTTTDFADGTKFRSPYVMPIASVAPLENLDASKLLEDYFNPKIYREASGDPGKMIGALHEAVYGCRAAASLSELLGDPAKRVLGELNRELEKSDLDRRVATIEIAYYNESDLHTLWRGIRPAQVRTRTYNLITENPTIGTLVRGNEMEDYFIQLAEAEKARRIIEVKFLDSHDTIIGWYGLASRDGVYHGRLDDRTRKMKRRERQLVAANGGTDKL